jgi:LysR family transcriptional regulator for metE and metH
VLGAPPPDDAGDREGRRRHPRGGAPASASRPSATSSPSWKRTWARACSARRRRLVPLPRASACCVAQAVPARAQQAEHGCAQAARLRSGGSCSEHGCYTAYRSCRRRSQFERRFPACHRPGGGGATRRPLPAARGSLDAPSVSTPRNAHIAYHTLFDDELVVVMAPAHRLARRALSRAGDLGTERCSRSPSRGKTATSSSACWCPPASSPRALPGADRAISAGPRRALVAVLARWAVAPDLAPAGCSPAAPARRGLRRRWFAATVARRTARPHGGVHLTRPQARPGPRPERC